jgi:hypothetical protein
VNALRLVLPWAVGLAIVAVLVVRIDGAALLAAFSDSDLVRYFPIALAFVALWLALDAWILSRLFSALGPRIAWARAAWLRASTYPLMAVSFHLGSAQWVAALAREDDRGLARCAGGMLVHYLADVAALAAVAFAGTWSGGGEAVAYLRLPLGAIALLCGGILLAGRMSRAFLRDRAVLEALASLPTPAIVELIAGRAAFHASAALFVFLAAPAFGLSAPLGALIGRMPIVLAVASLPISPGGLGTAHAAMLWLFEGFGSEARILAFGLIYSFTLSVLRLPLGAIAWWTLRAGRCADMEAAT